MQITVRGAKDKELTKWLKKATLFFAEQLMSPNIYENLSKSIRQYNMSVRINEK